MGRSEELSNQEFARLGNALFDELVRPYVDAEREAHKFVVIDVETGGYEVDESQVEATNRLLDRSPEAMGRTWLRRVGTTSAYRAGAHFQSPA